MLQITIPTTEYYDEFNECFVTVKGQTLSLEHSLVSISKWEQKWHKPFLTKDKRTQEENRDYVRCMTLTQNVDPRVYLGLTDAIMGQIMDYIDDPMTATWFPEEKNNKVNREIITSEIIYYWMIALDIPSDYQKWHLNRLLTLIRVCNAKNAPQKKMSKKDLFSRQRALNAARKQAFNTKG